MPLKKLHSAASHAAVTAALSRSSASIYWMVRGAERSTKMTREPARHPSWKDRSIKISTANPGDLEKRFREAVTRRAYQLFETHGCSPGHEGEDWKRAESELVRPLACGLLMEDDKISLSTDI